MLHSKVVCVGKQTLSKSKIYKDAEHMAALSHHQGICLGIFIVIPVVDGCKNLERWSSYTKNRSEAA